MILSDKRVSVAATAYGTKYSCSEGNGGPSFEWTRATPAMRVLLFGSGSSRQRQAKGERAAARSTMAVAGTASVRAAQQQQHDAMTNKQTTYESIVLYYMYCR